MSTVAAPVAEGVWRIPTAPMDLVNSYAFRDDYGQVTLVDAGITGASPRILAALATLGSAPSDVTRILLTHAHSDHAGGVAKLSTTTGADVAIHADDAEVLDIAGGLRVIHTPGHSPGHVSLLHEPTKLLITVDAIWNIRTRVTAFTHGPSIHDGARAAVRSFLRQPRRFRAGF